MKVLFLTRYPVEGASSRYRVFQYLTHLDALGVECHVQSFMSSDMYRLSFTPGKSARKILETFRASLRRLFVLRKYKSYDIVYMQRELFPFGPPLLERWMKRNGAVLFFDYDDALFIKKDSRYNKIASFFRSSDKIRDLFKVVDVVVAGNDWLRDEARKSGVEAITLEVAEDTDRIRMHAPHTNEKPVTIGWLGSSSTVKYLNFIQPALAEIATRYPAVRWEIMGGGDFAMKGVEWSLESWSLNGELEALRRFDIGLMPLPMEDWAKGKSGGKARTYMAAGIVPVCSAIGYNLELIDDGRTGFLCVEQERWVEVLSRLIEHPELRQAVASAARADVEARFAPRNQAVKLLQVFEYTLSGVAAQALGR